MAVVVDPFGLEIVADGESVTPATPHAGTWLSDGGGAPALPDTTAQIERENTQAIGDQFSEETGSLYFAATTTTWDISSGSRLYIWNRAHISVETKALRGVMIVLGDGTNRRGYAVGGSDDPGFDIGVWNNYILDIEDLPTNTHNFQGTGPPDLTAINEIGMGYTVPAKAVGNVDNMFVDIMRIAAVSGGIRITGGTPEDPGTFEEIATDDLSQAEGKAYGHVRRIQTGIFGIQGNLIFGDETGSTGTHFDDENAVVVLEDHKHGTGSGIPFSIRVVNALSSSFFQLGNAVGVGDDQVGSSGVQIRNANTGTFFSYDVTGSTNTTQSLFGFTFLGVISGSSASADPRPVLTFPTGTAAEASFSLSGGTFDQCGTVDLGQVKTRNCVFSGHAITASAALLWNSVIDMTRCAFRNNTDGTTSGSAGIEIPITGSFSMSGVTYAGNDYDVLNSSNGPVTLSIVGDGDVPTVFNSGSSTTLVIAQTEVTLTGLQSGSEIVVLDVDDESVIASVEDVGVDGEFAFTDSAGNIVDIFIHHINYVWQSIEDFTIPGTDTSIPIEQDFDRTYDNP
jgi:hypothetical protein